ncbi:hypothetical protein [Absidia glauca]|uniref:Rho-GAP domain-containing protein n=1 Tax=Absidia glauca TaxID=4829 RepID=A0A168S7L6_ABSGL|nr:hypothetical protein [Absidia glauca]
MSAQVMPHSPLSISTTPSQTEHLWKIIEKQRSIIQELQLSLAKVTEERDVLLKQNPPSDNSSPPDIDHYARRPLPLEPTLSAGSEERTPSPNRSVNTSSNSPTNMLDSTTPRLTTTNSNTTPTAGPTTSSPFDFMFANNLKKCQSNHSTGTNDTNANTINSAHTTTSFLPISQQQQHHELGNYYVDDDMLSTKKDPPMDEKDILLYTKYHEAVRSRHGSQPLPTNTASAFITHSPLPPPPQRHGPVRQQSAPAIHPINPFSNSSFLASNASFKLNSSPSSANVDRLPAHQGNTIHPSQQQPQQEPSYTLRKFIEEEPAPPTAANSNPVQRSMSVKQPSHSLDMVRYEDGYYDPSLEEQEPNYGSVVTTPKAPNPPFSDDLAPVPTTPTSSVPMLKDIMVQVLSANMTTNEKGKQIFSFTIAVGKISPSSSHGMDQLWRSEKLLSDFVNLDYLIKSKNPALAPRLYSLPDKALFVSKAPSKVDERKKAMETYIQQVLTLPLNDMSDVCEFLSTNVLEQKSGPPKRKLGYLTKRGKNFGGWKMRFFVLDGPTLNYYENKGGPYLGTINLARAQIGRQVVQSGSGDSFRHAFLILEPKKSAPNGIHRHVLCADSDLERDQWVEAMSQYINYDDFGQPPTSTTPPDYRQQLNKYLQRSRSDTSSFKKNRKNSAQRHARQRSSLDGADLTHFSRQLQQQQDDISDDDKKSKSRGFWGKKMFNTNANNSNGDSLAQTLGGGLSPDQATALMNSTGLTAYMDTSSAVGTKQIEKGPNQVFGIPLDEAIQVCRISQEYELPAVVYRCIEYLEAKNAAQEEGIYRLSGSASKIKKLKERFNQEGDVKLLDLEEYKHEVHAIAGLLKMWLRELPGSVLTMDLLNEFLRIAGKNRVRTSRKAQILTNQMHASFGASDIEDRTERTTELGRLVSLLPLSNYTLLRTLSAHLIRIVQNAGLNKMTLRNLGIVFSATLGIPALIFNLFISEFDYVFWTKQDQDQPILPPLSSPLKTTHAQQQQQPHESVTSVPRQPSTDDLSPKSSNGSIVGLSPPTIPPLSLYRRSNRNSIHYTDYAPQAIVGLEKRSEDFVAIIDEEDEDNTLGLDYDEIMDQHSKHPASNSSSPTHEYTATVIEPQIRQ